MQGHGRIKSMNLRQAHRELSGRLSSVLKFKGEDSLTVMGLRGAIRELELEMEKLSIAYAKEVV